jgi:hypothetical protein
MPFLGSNNCLVIEMDYKKYCEQVALKNAARRIIRDAEQERLRIAAYIRDAETALKPDWKA